VSLAGIEYVAAAKRRPETARMLARLGPSWTEIERLLGVLPPMAKVVRDGRSSVDEGSFVSARSSGRPQEAAPAAEAAPGPAGAAAPCQAEEKDAPPSRSVPVLPSWLAPADLVRGLADAAEPRPEAGAACSAKGEAAPLEAREALVPGFSGEMDLSLSPLAKRRAKQVAARSCKFSRLPPPMSTSSADEEVLAERRCRSPPRRADDADGGVPPAAGAASGPPGGADGRPPAREGDDGGPRGGAAGAGQ
ncbi:unnamed protein product, partial [Prorocentrum cordatum]